jgi:hypothetical protein
VDIVDGSHKNLVRWFGTRKNKWYKPSGFTMVEDAAAAAASDDGSGDESVDDKLEFNKMEII